MWDLMKSLFTPETQDWNEENGPQKLKTLLRENDSFSEFSKFYNHNQNKKKILAYIATNEKDGDIWDSQYDVLRDIKNEAISNRLLSDFLNETHHDQINYDWQENPFIYDNNLLVLIGNTGNLDLLNLHLPYFKEEQITSGLPTITSNNGETHFAVVK